MKCMEEDEIMEYIEKTNRFHEKCYAIFRITVQEDDPDAIFDRFVIYNGSSIIYFNNCKGDPCEYIFPTEWLSKDSEYIMKERKNCIKY